MAIPILTKISEYFNNKRLARLEKDLKSLNGRMSFNPKFAYRISNNETSENFTRRQEEYLAWYSGNSNQLRDLYVTQANKNLNYFWFRAPTDVRKIHCGVPGLIATKMAGIVFGSGYETEVSVYNADKSVNAEQSSALLEHLEYIRKKVKMKDIIDKSAQAESYSGHLFIKQSHDLDLSHYPIVEVATPRNAEALKERGITTAIIFKYWHEHKDKEYRLDEIYTTDDNGDAMIIYKLYTLTSKGEVQVNLFSIPQTAELSEAVNEDGAIIYVGLKGMLAFEKPNISPSHEFPDSPYGASDFEGSLDSFDALDEVYTEIVNEARENKTLREMPDTMIPIATGIGNDTIDSEGRQFIDAKFITNFIITTGDIDQNTKQQPRITQIQDKTEQHKEKFKTILTTVINNAGINPIALGITGLESIDASEKSQQERNKVTIQLCLKKQDLWTPFLEEFYLQLVIFNSWLVKKFGIKQPGYLEQDINFENCDIKIKFNDYMLNSQSELNNTWLPVKQGGGISLERFVKKTNPDMTPEEVEEEVNRLRYEQGMALDSPDALPDLDGTEEIVEETEKEKE